jgi:hypothetical protein
VLAKIEIEDDFFITIDAVSKSSGLIYKKMAQYI